MSQKLLIATHNQGKVREYRALLSDLPLEVTYLDAEGITFEAEETGATFADNAIQKARAYATATGLLTWADDSGLDVDALNGAPGVLRCSHASPQARSDQDRYRLLLAQLAGVPEDSRTARFHCVVALVWPDGQVHTADGVCEGRIGFEPRGSHGFGYDPIFLVAEAGYTQTMAELDPGQKNNISHRGRAAQAAKRVLRDMLDT